jgi:hypothetical protein
MRGTHYVTLEELGHDSSLEVEILFDYTPGERMVMYYPDGSGYPGIDSSVEFLSAYVTRWDVGREERKRGVSWLWDLLDVIAGRIISEGWDRFQEGCLESMDERIRERGYDD